MHTFLPQISQLVRRCIHTVHTSILHKLSITDIFFSGQVTRSHHTIAANLDDGDSDGNESEGQHGALLNLHTYICVHTYIHTYEIFHLHVTMSVEEGSSDYKLASRRGGGKTQRKKSKQDSSNRVEGKYYVLYVCM